MSNQFIFGIFEKIRINLSKSNKRFKDAYLHIIYLKRETLPLHSERKALCYFLTFLCAILAIL